ncbi:MAG: YggS family pyridoxal phosphate-dependent enzyme [Clostridia bacterium]|nr:YggS family pyridoxal phosphate-dependent enzyme [Clostridia bacterium]MBQ7046772.1 YggS family pyridoxal phosphate-dependent enzyme [Oscillospiraceae bacterium]
MEKSLTDERFLLLEDNLKKVRDEIAQTALKSGRNPDDIKLMAVTKTVCPELINHAISCGVDLIGENKVQEVLAKKDELNLETCKLHLIGHLQSNKVKKIVGIADMIQSVDSFEIASQISKRSEENGIVTDVLLEVNIGDDDCKFGYSAQDVEEELCKIAQLRGVKVKGMMTVAPNFKDSVKNQSVFANMRKLFIDISAKKIDNISMDILSMGMSGDFKEAIAEGSTLVRVGSAIFGERKY